MIWGLQSPMAWSLKQNPDYGELVESKIVIRRSLQLKKRLKQKIFLLLEHLDCPKQATQERKDSNKKLCPIAISSQIDITRGKKRTLRIKSKELVSQLSQRRSACQEEESICGELQLFQHSIKSLNRIELCLEQIDRGEPYLFTNFPNFFGGGGDRELSSYTRYARY